MDFNDRADQIIVENRRNHRDRMATLDKRIREATPRFVKTVTIYGSYYQNIYDHAPEVGCFTTETCRSMNLDDYDGIESAKIFALNEYKILKSDFDLQAGIDECYEPFEGLFSPHLIVLVDQLGEVVTRYYNNIWEDTDDLPMPGQWDSLLEKAEALESEASFESGWDNFSTAKGLRAEARNIKHRVQIAKNIDKLATSDWLKKNLEPSKEQKKEYVNQTLMDLLSRSHLSETCIDSYFLDEIYHEAQIEGYNDHDRTPYNSLLVDATHEVLRSFLAGWENGSTQCEEEKVEW